MTSMRLRHPAASLAVAGTWLATATAVTHGYRSAPDVVQPAPAPPVVTNADVTKWMVDLSNWGRWGKDDQRGTSNLITPEVRKRALTLVRDAASSST